MALYTIKNRNQAFAPIQNYNGNNNWVLNQRSSMGFAPTQDQTQIYNMIGRDAGLQQQGNFWDNPIGNAWEGFKGNIENRARAAENAIGTTLAAPISFIDTARENANIEERQNRWNNSLNDIARKYGYADRNDYWDKLDAAEQAGNTELLNKMKASGIDDELKAQAAANANEAKQAADNWRDYRENSYVGKKINQDQGKFAGDALTTLSTAADIAAMTTGLPMGVVANTIQGGVEGLANELSTNGFENFDWGRAGQNIASGALAGAATAGLNKALGARAAAKAIPGAKAPGLLKSVAQGAGRGVLSGAVGGAVGGGVGGGINAAINNQDIGAGILQGTLSGAGQGAVSGGVSGGIMGGVSNLGGRAVNAIDRKFGTNLGEISQTGAKWQNSGKNFNERLTNTLNSGDSAVGNWINGKQSKTLNSIGNIGNRISPVGSPKYNKAMNLAKEALDAFETADPYGFYESMAEMAELEGLDWNTPKGKKAYTEKWLQDATRDILTGGDNREMWAGSLEDYIGQPQLNGDTVNPLNGGTVENERLQNLVASIRDFDQTETPTTASGWAKKALRRAGEDLSNKGVGLSLKNVNDDDALIKADWDSQIKNRGNQKDQPFQVFSKIKDFNQLDDLAMRYGYTDFDEAPYEMQVRMVYETGQGDNGVDYKGFLDNNPVKIGSHPEYAADSSYGNDPYQRVYSVSGTDEQYTFASNDNAPRNVKQAAVDYAYETDGRVDPAELTDFYNQTRNVPNTDVEGMAMAIQAETDGRVDANELLDFVRAQDGATYGSTKAINFKGEDTPTTAKGWLKKAGQRLAEDINKTNLGNRIQDVSDDQAFADSGKPWQDSVRQQALNDYYAEQLNGTSNGDEVLLRNARQALMEADPDYYAKTSPNDDANFAQMYDRVAQKLQNVQTRGDVRDILLKNDIDPTDVDYLLGATQYADDMVLDETDTRLYNQNRLSRMKNKVVNSIDNARTKYVNRGAVDRLADALENGSTKDVKFTRLTKELINDANSVRQAQGIEPLTDRQVKAYKGAIPHLAKRVQEGMSPREAAQVAYNALTNPEAFAGASNLMKGASTPIIATDEKGRYNQALINYASTDGGTSLKSIIPNATDSQIKRLLSNKEALNSAAGVANPASLSDEPSARATVSGRRTNSIIPQNAQNGNYPDDIMNMVIKDNNAIPDNSASTELYRQLTGDNGSQTVEAPQTANIRATGDKWDSLAQEYGYNTYNDAIRAFQAANPGKQVSAGAVTTWLDANEGDYNPNQVQITQNATMPTEIQEAEIVPSKTSRETKLKYAQGKELLAQYGAVDQPMARATKAPETFQKLAEMGFTKPGDVEKISNAITGSNGAVSKLTKSVIASAKPVNTFDGETAGQTMDDFINNSIEHNMLSGTNQGKAVKRGIDAYLRSLPSHADGSITMEDSAADAFKVVQGLEARAAELEGRGGSTYHRATTEDVHQAAVLKDVANLLKDRIYAGANVKAALTPEVAQELKAFDPKNTTWAKTVDDFVSSAKTAQDLRSFQKPFVRASRYIDNQYVQAATAGGRMAASAGELPAILPTTKAGIIKQVVNNVWNSNPAHRARAAAYGKLAENAANAPQTTTQPTASNPQTAVYDLLNRNNTLNIIGRNLGEEMGQKALPIENYIEEASAEAGYMPPLAATTSTAGSLEDLANTSATTTTTPTTLVDSLGGGTDSRFTGQFSNTGNDQVDLLGRAMELAMAADDATAFGALYSMYASALQKADSTSDLSAAQQTQLAKFDSADDAINELEALYNQAGGGKGPIAGNLQSVAGDWGWDSGARTYNQMAEGLVNQIAQAIGKTDSLNTEGEVKRALKLVPSLTDDAQTAQNKLRTLREMLAQTKANYYGAYGVSN